MVLQTSSRLGQRARRVARSGASNGTAIEVGLVGARCGRSWAGSASRRSRISSWEEDRVGFLEIDLVAHYGDTNAGEYINTLSTVDLASGWPERVAVMGKSQKVVFAALKRIREQFPFVLRGFHSDNGSGFLNGMPLEYCRAEKIAFSRSRPYRPQAGGGPGLRRLDLAAMSGALHAQRHGHRAQGRSARSCRRRELEQAREVGALAKFGDLQLQGAYPGVPLPVSFWSSMWCLNISTRNHAVALLSKRLWIYTTTRDTTLRTSRPHLCSES
jgi:hypothetical protein